MDRVAAEKDLHPHLRMTGRVGISLGDVTGIGPEVALKAVAAESKNDDLRYLFIGDAELLARLNEKLSLNLPLKSYAGDQGSNRFVVANSFREKMPADLPPGAPLAANASMAWLRDAGERCLRGELDAMV